MSFFANLWQSSVTMMDRGSTPSPFSFLHDNNQMIVGIGQSLWRTLSAASSLMTIRPNVTRLETALTANPPILPTRRHTTTTMVQQRQQQREQALETLVDVTLNLSISIGMAVVAGLVAKWLVQILQADANNGSDDAKDRPSANRITKRLLHILQKRAQAVADASDDNPDDAPKSSSNKKTLKKVVVPKVQLPPLTTYELQMACQIIDPDDIESSFRDIGGLDATKRELYELAVLPLVEPLIFGTSKLVQPCKGILLYGPPGTGKTLLGKALAKEAAAVFLPLPLSTILNKWVGESNKLVAATFSLATKLAPAIIFIDELDTFLKANTSETAYLDTIKSEFLTCWDGVTTQSASQVLVLGATNKPRAIDPAILRRMPRAFAVPLPDQDGRKAILTLLLQDEGCTPDARAYVPTLAARTPGYSGSDLKELCKAAAMVRIQEKTAAYAAAKTSGKAASLHKVRTEATRLICAADLRTGHAKVPKTGEAAKMYDDASTSRSAPKGEVNMQHVLAALLRQVSDLSVRENGAQGEPTRSNGRTDDDEMDEIPQVE
jgi:SpoVK/Ycf46/Vps4 family AAA+-type ATPase